MTEHTETERDIARKARKAEFIRKFVATHDGRCKLLDSMLAPLRMRIDYMGLPKLLLEAPALKGDAEPEAGAVLFDTSLEFTLDFTERPWSSDDPFLFWVEQMQDRFRIHFQTFLDEVIAGWFSDQAGEPETEPFDPWPRGRLVTSPRSYAALRKSPMNNDFDAETDREYLRSGLMGKWREMLVHTSRAVPGHRVYRLGRIEEVGSLRYDIDLEYDEANSSSLIFVAKGSLKGRIVPPTDAPPLVKAYQFATI